MRIAMMCETTGPGGVEFVMLQLSEALRRRGHHIHPIGPRLGGDWLRAQFLQNDFPWSDYRIRRALDPLCLFDLIRHLRRERIELVHSHEFTMAVYGGAAAWLLGIPHVTSMHGNMTMTEAARRRMALRWVIGRARATVAVSNHTRRHLEQTLGIPPRVIETIHNGLVETDGRANKIRQELKLEEEEVLILSVGNLHARKAHWVLLEAMARLSREAVETPWRLAIAGDGPERERLETISRENDLGGRVHLLGYRDDIADLQAAASIFVAPSLWEGLPLVVLEAMFAGNAIVATHVAGIPEAVDDGQTAILTGIGNVDDVADGIRRLLCDARLREQMGRAARARAEKQFTIGAMTNAYERAYAGRHIAGAAT